MQLKKMNNVFYLIYFSEFECFSAMYFNRFVQ